MSGMWLKHCMKEAVLAGRSQRDGLVKTGTADLMRGLGTCLGFSRANVCVGLCIAWEK